MEKQNIFRGEKVYSRGANGEERILVSIECQTEWSWLEDMQRIQALTEKQSRYSFATSTYNLKRFKVILLF